MKKEFQNAKIVVGENSKEIQEILFGLGYRWDKQTKPIVSNLSFPFLYLNNSGLIGYGDNNEFFYKHQYPIITLDTLKQWQRENVELVEGEFYYGYETKEKHASIFQYKKKYKEYVDVYFGIFINNKYNNIILFLKDDNIFIDINSPIRPANLEEIQLLKDKVKEHTGKVFNEETKIFEEVKKGYEFKPFDKILGRYNDNQFWQADLFSHIEPNKNIKYYGVSQVWKYILPYEGNEHLLGTTNNPE